MKTLLTAVSVSLVLAGSLVAQPAQASGAAALNGICDNVAADNKSRFRKKLKESGFKLRDVYEGVSCGGENLVRYAMKSNANSVGSYIVKRMPASHFAGSGDADWAASNGFANSPIVEAIASR